MTRPGLFFVLVPMLLALAGCASLSGDMRAQLGADGDRDRQILVTVPQGREVSTALLGPPAERYRHRRGYGAAPRVERTLRQLAREHDVARVEGWPIASLDVYCEVLEVPAGVSIEALLRRLESDERVDLAQRMNTFETLSSRYDDTYADLQAAVLDLEVESAHELATGRGVTVAVIDSGVDTRHPELRGRVVLARDLVESAPMPREGEVHGTAMAGVIASAANNTQGIVGIAPDVSVAALRACRPDTAGAARARCSTLSLARALDLAFTMSPDVVNLSLNGPRDPLLSRLLARVLERGIVVVTARPDPPRDAPGFPWSEPGVIVAQPAASKRGDPASGYLLGAPADEILTTAPSAGYAFLSGSSLAAAHVSGITALLIERRPSMGTERIETLLRDTATDRAGRRTVNACRALTGLIGLGICGSASGVVTAEGESRTTD